MVEYWYQGMRVLHILCAVLWVGSAVFLTLYLSPAIRALGPQGAPVMAELMRRRMGLFLAAAGIVTVLSGIWMYWVFTSGFNLRLMTHGAGLVLGIGGLLGILGSIVGGGLVGRTAERAGRLARTAAQLPPGGEREATMVTVAALQHRVAIASRLDATLLLAALLAMCIAHIL